MNLQKDDVRKPQTFGLTTKQNTAGAELKDILRDTWRLHMYSF